MAGPFSDIGQFKPGTPDVKGRVVDVPNWPVSLGKSDLAKILAREGIVSNVVAAVEQTVASVASGNGPIRSTASLMRGQPQAAPEVV
jgi:hypothetical protein